MNSTPSILISIPATSNEPWFAFVAAPLSPEFSQHRDAMSTAALGAGLQPHLTSERPENSSFAIDILRCIRKARIVLALCTPDSRTNTPNLNVLYEVGLAHSIGKPTLLIVDSPKSLPSDIGGQHSVVYGTFRHDSFVKQVEVAILQVLQRTKSGIVDPAAAEGISLICSNAFPLWRDVATILDAAKRAHNRYQATQTGHLQHLASELTLLAYYSIHDPAEIARRKHIWGRAWKQYSDFNEYQITMTHAELARLLSDAESAIARLRDHVHQRLHCVVDHCQSFFKQLCANFGVVPALHDEANRVAVDALNEPNSGADHNWATHLLPKVDTLNETVSRIITSADGLLLNLVPLILSREDEK